MFTTCLKKELNLFSRIPRTDYKERISVSHKMEILKGENVGISMYIGSTITTTVLYW